MAAEYEPVVGIQAETGEMYANVTRRLVEQNAPILQPETKQHVPIRINGGYAPGETGNPNGRPAPLVSQALKRRFEEGEAEKLADTLIEIAKTGEKDSDRIAAINSAVDRVEGKPTQTINQRGLFVIVSPDDTLVSSAFDQLPPDVDQPTLTAFTSTDTLTEK